MNWIHIGAMANPLARSARALVMVGRWGLTFQVAPRNGPPFTALIIDQAKR